MSTLFHGGGSGGGVGKCSKRRYRRRYPLMQLQSSTAAEERLLQQAIQNSKLDKGRPPDGKLCIPQAPVFYPTVEDFEGNPLNYVERIRPVAEKYGICKIVPPVGWNPGPHFSVDLNSSQKFQTKQQLLHRLQEGISFGDGVEYTPSEYLRVASERTSSWKATYYPDHDLFLRHTVSHEPQNHQQNDSQTKTSTPSSNLSIDDKLFSPANIERDYWDIVEKSKEVIVEYGNDVDTQVFGSGFPMSERGRALNGTKDSAKVALPEPKLGDDDYYKETWWNLNNIPGAPDSVLRHVKVGITGINVPWMYYGSLFTTFCWHNEDNNLYSINYHHKGAPKQWYGIPGTKECADGLENVFKSYLSMKMREIPDLLHHITTMFSPRLLQNAGVPVYKLLQYEGEFVITFPRSFHSGFSLGPNIGEAVNFATHDWISFGSDANEKYRSLARPSVFSHDRLSFTMANHLRDQKTYKSCTLLLSEIARVVEEEMQMRKKLSSDGIRDVSSLIRLPKNRLDQLDESSAAYDDKRLCHACKHVCFFSAVACECSHSKVSCLRHSHFMCRCPPKRKYFLIWCSDGEMNATLERVRKHCIELTNLIESPIISSVLNNATNVQGTVKKERSSDKVDTTSSIVPGVAKDTALHKNYDIPTGIITQESLKSLTDTAIRLQKLNGQFDLDDANLCNTTLHLNTTLPSKSTSKRSFDEANLAEITD